MDSTSPIIPSPSTGWGRPVPIHGEASIVAGTAKPQRREDDAFQLKARLLRLIVNNEHSRKSAAIEANNDH